MGQNEILRSSLRMTGSAGSPGHREAAKSGIDDRSGCKNGHNLHTALQNDLRDHVCAHPLLAIEEYTMSDVRKGAVTLKGNPVDLVGKALTKGSKAPDFSLQSNSLEEVTLATSRGKTRIIATVPSLDTAVCQLETKKFNEQAAALPDVEILVVSMDLPFGQKRWCGAENVDKVKTLSAHRCTRFGEDYGVLIQGGPLDRCLCRAVFVIDRNDHVSYAEYCGEIADHPNYEAALAAAK
jgi:thiol peroxidase